MEEYDLIVIGSGPAGEKAAVKAGYFGYKVALIEKQSVCGGAGVNTGTLPSKTLKETSLYLSGKYDKGLYGVDKDLDKAASVEHFLYRKNYIVETESKEVRENILRHGITLYQGAASFEDTHTIRISGPKEALIKGKHIIIATGSSPTHPSSIPFNKKRIHDSDTILEITRFPSSIAIPGAGVIGLEYATIFGTMGCKVFLLNRSDKILPFVDQQIVKELLVQMADDNIELLFNKSILSISEPRQEKETLDITLEGGERLHVDMFLFAAGRNGNVSDLNLSKAGITVDNRENIPVNDKYQTIVPHIYAVGDVIGFPALASTSMDQGRVAVSHIFNTKDISQIAQVIPYGIYTVPEISTVGISEEEAKKQNLNYNIGIARHKDMPRGKIMGAKSGMLKIVFTKEDQIIRGVHIIGALATEMIHYGVQLINQKKTLLEVIGSIYNVPTLHELYKYAAYDGLSNLAGHKVKP
jgi:NAD(P) transhydrogenase